MAEEKMDWLMNFINDGVAVPWEIVTGIRDERAQDDAIYGMFQDHAGGWFDIDLEKEDPGAKAMKLAERLEDCTKDQLMAMAEILYIAIKTTLVICNSDEDDEYESEEDE